MKNNFLIFISLLFLFQFSCKKEEAYEYEEVEIFEKGPQNTGFAKGFKNGKPFEATAEIIIVPGLEPGLSIYTMDNRNTVAEVTGLPIPKFKKGTYRFPTCKTDSCMTTQTGYSLSDFDVFLAIYHPKKPKTSCLRIDCVDEEKRIIKGECEIILELDKDYINSGQPKKLYFEKIEFEVNF